MSFERGAELADRLLLICFQTCKLLAKILDVSLYRGYTFSNVAFSRHRLGALKGLPLHKLGKLGKSTSFWPKSYEC